MGLLTLLFACDGSPDSKEEASEEIPPPLVEVAELQSRQVRRVIETSSYLESEHRVTVLPKVAGRVTDVLVDEGQRVQVDEILARLDDREAKSRVRQAEIQLADARVKHALAKLEAEASVHRVTQAEIERDKAKDTHERNKSLSRDLIAEREIEESGYALSAAEEALRVAGFDRRKAQLEVDAAQNTIDDLDAKLADARIQLEDHEIRARLDGVIESLAIKGGETITAATELMVIVDDESLVSYLSRPQRELAMLRDAKDVQYTTDAWENRDFIGHIDLVSPVVNQDNGQFRIRMRVTDEDAKDLRPGMFVRAKILTENEREALMVPKAAVLNDGIESVVFVVRDGTARRIRLDPGLEEVDYLEARNTGDAGLSPGDIVIVSGHRELRDQAAVEVAGE